MRGDPKNRVGFLVPKSPRVLLVEMPEPEVLPKLSSYAQPALLVEMPGPELRNELLVLRTP